MAAIDNNKPPDIQPVGADATRTGADDGTALRGIDRIEDHQPRVVDDAIGIRERGAKRPLQRIAHRMMGEIDRRRCRKAAARCQPVVEQQARPQQPWRSFIGMRGDNEAHRTHEVRRDPQPAVAFSQRRAHAKEAPAFQRGKVAMDQPGRRRGRRSAKIILFQQNDPQTSSRGIAGNAGAVQPTADNRNVVVRHL
jgi:hypothetical protein